MADPLADRHDFGTPGLVACVKADGAELCLLRDPAGVDYLWPAGPAWPRHAPVLFPIVGRLVGDTLTHDGRDYRMTQHGFARDRRFAWVERHAAGCTLALTDDAASLAIYPFPFRLEIAYAATGPTLSVTYTLTNPGTGTLPASFGAHPAFRWPLEPGVAKEDYALTFDAPEPGALRELAGGLLTGRDRASPIAGSHLALTEALFEQDALILAHPASRSVRFAAATGPGLTVAWSGFDQLGLWSRPGADFLCIEPWCGMASPADFTGEFMDKPWLMLIPPGGSRTATQNYTLEPGSCDAPGA